MAATSKATVPVTVLVSESTEIGCELLCSGLTSNLQELVIAAAGTSSKSILQAVAECCPAVLLVSLVLQDGPTAGLTVLKEVRKIDPKTACVLMIDHPSSDIAMEAFRRGARGVFLRTSRLPMLWRCIDVVRSGQIWISSADLCSVLASFSTTPPLSFNNAKGEELLTNREREMVALVMQGLSNREIAQQARISGHTVKNYLLRIFDKLGVSSRAELIVQTIGRLNGN